MSVAHLISVGSANAPAVVMGQNLPLDDTDDQLACAFGARHVGGRHHENRCSASREWRVPLPGDRFRPYRVGGLPASRRMVHF
jgi:hypothetical protein